MKYWALAFWEGWFPEATLVKTINDARAKLNGFKMAWCRFIR